MVFCWYVLNHFCFHCTSRVEVSANAKIENLISTTVVFPDSDLPAPTNGGFKNQKAFREYVMELQQGGGMEFCFTCPADGGTLGRL